MNATTTEQSTASELERKHHLQLYKRYPITIVKGSGARVLDDRGREYIDALAGIGVNSVGHCHPDVVEAIRRQAGLLMHSSNLYYTEPQSRLAKRLTEAAGMERVFFTNSGTEAVEGAFKLARKHAKDHGRSGSIISLDGCFHGRSMGALSTHSEKQRAPFEPLLPGFARAPFDDTDALAAAVDDNTVAVILEAVQGEGGIRPLSDDYLRAARRLCDEHGALLIADEIQCGIGRTGRFYAYEHAGIEPDIVTTAKALGGGMPIGAVLVRGEAADTFAPGDHGTTFGGNPVACAAADAAVRIVVEQDLPARAAELGAHLFERLRGAMDQHSAIREVRGRGLMAGVELAFEGKQLVLDLLERGVLANCTQDTVIRFLPPLVISREDLDRALDVFLDVLGKAEAEQAD
ncbi:MAG: Acetylornithine aminotransferase [Calditrichaeota bacterium]|nr:Acetylornithine aminotransferase [Calditrichota bacterium]